MLTDDDKITIERAAVVLYNLNKLMLANKTLTDIIHHHLKVPGGESIRHFSLQLGDVAHRNPSEHVARQRNLNKE